jgi:multidrug efflux pump subunit AcrA (membrane-fusion protein)
MPRSFLMTRSVWLGLAACTFAVLLAGCNKPEEKPLPAPPPVSPPPPVVTNVAVPATPPAIEMPTLPLMVATIKGAGEVPVKAPQAGYLVRQVYRNDAMVATGDVLFLLDPRVAHVGSSPGSANDSALVKVIAPATGVPGLSLHGAGDRLQAGDELTTIAQIDNVIAELTLPSAVAESFKKYLNSPAGASEQPAIELILPDGSVYPTSGVVANVATSGSVNTMQIGFPNPGHVLQPGEYVKVRSAAPWSSAPAPPTSSHP